MLVALWWLLIKLLGHHFDFLLANVHVFSQILFQNSFGNDMFVSDWSQGLFVVLVIKIIISFQTIKQLFWFNNPGKISWATIDIAVNFDKLGRVNNGNSQLIGGWIKLDLILDKPVNSTFIVKVTYDMRWYQTENALWTLIDKSMF